MENNKLKEKIRKNIKEKIAISNIRKEFDMKTGKNKKVIYMVSSLCAIFILVIGIFIGTGKLNDNFQIGGTGNINDSQGEKVNIKLNINNIKDMAMMKLDGDIQKIEIKDLPEKFKFAQSINVPDEYKLENSYNIYVRSNREIAEYDILHDYVLEYRKDEINNIRITFSEIEEPLRDYYIDGADKISKIGDTELIIAKWKDMYIATFKYKDIYFDIETNGITEDELVDMILSIIKTS